MKKNFDTLHIGGVYKTKSAEEEIGVVVPENLYICETNAPFVCRFIAGDDGRFIGWNPYDEKGVYLDSHNYSDKNVNDSYELVEYVGEYDFYTKKIIYNKEEDTIDDNEVKCPVVVSDLLITETVRNYDLGIFRAKVRSRDEEIWVNFDSRGGMDEDVYGYTLNEFKELMTLLKRVEISLEEND